MYGESLVLNYENHWVKGTIEKEIGEKLQCEGNREEIMTYNPIIYAIYEENEDHWKYWVFKDIIGHRKDQKKPTKWQIKVVWDSDEKSWEPVHIMRKVCSW